MAIGLHVFFMGDWWSELLDSIIATFAEFIDWLKWIIMSFVFYYIILWLVHFKFPKAARFAMEIVCYVIGIISPKFAAILFIPFEDKKEKEKKEKAEKKKEALKTLAEDD